METVQELMLPTFKSHINKMKGNGELENRTIVWDHWPLLCRFMCRCSLYPFILLLCLFFQRISQS